MKLIIVESPSKTKTIEKILGSEYKVTSSKGHIKNLKNSGKFGLGVDVDNDFKADYGIVAKQRAVVKELKELTSQAEKVYLATDPDREGEAIAYSLLKELKLDENDDNRIVFNEITAEPIKAALNNPTKVDLHLVESSQTRQVLDKIIGYRLSNLLQRKISAQSAGRVQSVALMLIVEKEEEIKAFIPVKFYNVNTTIKIGSKEYPLETIKVENEEDFQQALDFEVDELAVEKIETKQFTSKPRIAFTTSSLQQTASLKLNFPVRKTMQVAQQLYEGIEIDGEQTGLITYMRTDSTRLSEEFVKNACGYVKGKLGSDYVQGYFIKSKKANIQDAHEGIRVTYLKYEPSEIEHALTKDQFKLYNLIWQRSLACVTKPPVYNKTKVSFEKTGMFEFKLRGSQLIFPGYLEFESEITKDIILPEIKENETFDVTKLEKTEEYTKPPARYNESKLVKTMEELGIGRPSTYAIVIDTLKKRNYVEVIEKTFRPTEIAFEVNKALKEFFSDIINVEYTAKMEERLDLIAEDKDTYLNTIKDFYNAFADKLDKANENMEKLAPKNIGRACPECGHDLVERVAKRTGQKFIACSNFPKCKYTESIEVQNDSDQKILDQLKDFDIRCEKCGSELVKRVTKTRKVFYGCSKYPECDYAIWDNQLKKLLTEKKKGN